MTQQNIDISDICLYKLNILIRIRVENRRDNAQNSKYLSICNIIFHCICNYNNDVKQILILIFFYKIKKKSYAFKFIV